MTVTGGSALGKDEIDKMVKDAEANEEADKARRESVDMRNEADMLALRTDKLLTDNGDKLSDDVKTPVTESLAALKEALKGTDNDSEVKAAMDDLNQKASAMGQAVYEAAQKEQAASEASAADAGESAGDDDVVDAEVVDEDDKKDDDSK